MGALSEEIERMLDEAFRQIENEEDAGSTYER